MRNNYGALVGTIVGNIEYNHTCHMENFYLFNLAIFRTSGTQDVVPVIISERLMHFSNISVGARLYIEGSVRTLSIHTESGKNRLLVYFFAETVFDNGGAHASKSYFINPNEDFNNIYLHGTICKEVVYRETPRGRQISDLLLAVNRTHYGKSDYIPVIAWSRNSLHLSSLSVGDKISVSGRFQSRTHQKKNPDGSFEERTVYEVSVYNIEGTERNEKD